MMKQRLFALLLLLLLPARAFALTCEPPTEPTIAGNLMMVEVNAAIEEVTAETGAEYLAESEAQVVILEVAVEALQAAVLGALDGFRDFWHDGLKDMARQGGGSTIITSLQRGQHADAVNVERAKQEKKRQERLAQKQYKPTAQSCKFDTQAMSYVRTQNLSKAMTKAYARDFNKIGTANDANATAAALTLQKKRWDTYRSTFCDGDSNAGVSGCSKGNARANMHVMPSRTLFAKTTIDMKDKDTREAVKQLLFNITGYEMSGQVDAAERGTSGGQERMLENREYATQMDAVGALAYGVVADRTPGPKDESTQAILRKIGVADASPTPSAREVREAMVGQLWDPNYYNDLYDNPATVTQKEVYLRAYNLLLLQQLIARQEKISTVYAIETANMLKTMDGAKFTNGAR